MCVTHTYYPGMTTHVEATYTVGKWHEEPYAELDGGTRLTHASWVQSYEGDLQGEETVHCLMYYRPDGTVLTVALTSFVGSLGGRSGSFVSQINGGYADGQATGDVSAVAGSGTGALQGLRGTGNTAAGSDMKGRFTFDYDLG
jgi:Protein of unknown function (DUF3224)